MKKLVAISLTLFLLSLFAFSIIGTARAADNTTSTDTTASTSTDDASYYDKLLQSLQVLRGILDEITSYLGGSSTDTGTTGTTTDTGTSGTANTTGDTTSGTDTSNSTNTDLSQDYPALLGGSGSQSSSTTTKTASKDDKDGDGVKNADDKCPDSKDDGTGLPNQNPQSPYWGCTCSQILAKGGYQQQTTCPGQSCSGSYVVTYTQQPGSCNNGNPVQPQCVANQVPDQNCAAIDQQKQQQQAAQDAQKQSQMAQMADALKKMMEAASKQQPKEQGQCNQSQKCQCPGGKPPIRVQDECSCCDPMKGCAGTASGKCCGQK